MATTIAAVAAGISAALGLGLSVYSTIRSEQQYSESMRRAEQQEHESMRYSEELYARQMADAKVANEQANKQAEETSRRISEHEKDSYVSRLNNVQFGAPARNQSIK